ncbi:agamous-like MADS-box protein AGL28 [Prosopis cineraria]|uniref:agamous-like MADS-box protein AGL28 n=1 Tax=Prosopis cineraria TaxID=364024 RepID=UPI0024107058|nr:agamous-like MADS-box protein AGL28 [Prosopis cineraria]
MGRRNLSMRTLQNRNARRALFERRKKGLLKKASELSTLCGIEACVIIFPPPDSENPKVETFPQDPAQVIRNIQEYNAKRKCPEKLRKNYDLCEFFNDRKNQVEAETSRIREQRFKMLYPTWDDSFNNLGEGQLRMFITALDSKLQECNQTIGLLKSKKSDMTVVPIGSNSLNDHCLEMPVTIISADHLSDETHLGFMQNMSDESNAVSAPTKPLVADNNTDMLESYSLQAHTLGFCSTCGHRFDNPTEKRPRMFTGSTSDSDNLQECYYQMIDMFKTKSLNDQCMGTPIVPLQDISNQCQPSFLQNTLSEDNLVCPRTKTLVDNTSNGLTESYSLLDQMLHHGLENINLDMLLGLEFDPFDPILV